MPGSKIPEQEAERQKRGVSCIAWCLSSKNLRETKKNRNSKVQIAGSSFRIMSTRFNLYRYQMLIKNNRVFFFFKFLAQSVHLLFPVCPSIPIFWFRSELLPSNQTPRHHGSAESTLQVGSKVSGHPCLFILQGQPLGQDYMKLEENRLHIYYSGQQKPLRGVFSMQNQNPGECSPLMFQRLEVEVHTAIDLFLQLH